VTVGLVAGGGIHGWRSGSTEAAFRLGGYADVLFFRRRGSDMAVGPFAELLTTNFASMQVGGGLAWLIPMIAPDLPFVVSTGFSGRRGAAGWQPMVGARLFWGSRSFNFHGAYGTTVGLFVDGRLGLAGSQAAEAVLGVQLDASFLAFPFLFAASAAK
jgi:hypothetical protein